MVRAMKWKKNYNPIKTGRKLYREFERGRWFQEARDYLGDKDRMGILLGLVSQLFRNRTLAPVVKDLLLLYYYVKDVASGHYREYSRGKVVLIVALLIYVVTPIDIIPDWLPGIGFLDDMALLGYVVKMADAELQRYYKWSKKQAESVKTTTT